jgi:hypothetical protein
MLNKYSLTIESLLFMDESPIARKITPAHAHALRYPQSLAVREDPLLFSMGEPQKIWGHSIKMRPALRLASQRGGQYGLAR